MLTFPALLDALADAAPEDREAAYAGAAVLLDEDELHARATAGHLGASWVWLRAEGGPPGTPLPGGEDALRALVEARPTPADVVRLAFGPLPDEPEVHPADLLFRLTFAAIELRLPRLARWLASRTALVELAIGDQEHAWRLLDLFPVEPGGACALPPLTPFLPLRGSPELLGSWGSRLAAWFLWNRNNETFAWPDLPLPEGPEGTDALEQVAQVAPELAALVTRILGALRERHARLQAEHEDHPLVAELERRVLRDEGPPDWTGPLPDWFETWALDRARLGQGALARLAGWLLRGTASPRTVAVLVWPLARAIDLPLLREGFPEAPVTEVLDALAAAADHLPESVADALVAMALPRHLGQVQAVGVLTRHLAALDALALAPESPLYPILAEARAIEAQRRADQEAALPRREALQDAARALVERLGDPRRLRAEELEAAAGRLEVPEPELGLLETAHQGLEPLAQVLVGIALAARVRGTAFAHWDRAFLDGAQRAIFALKLPNLFPLRLSLLDRLLADASAGRARAEWLFQRANTRRGIGSGGDEALAAVLDDMAEAATEARRHGAWEVLVDAVTARAKLLAFESTHRSDLAAELREAENALAVMLGEARLGWDRALIQQARAHLVRAARTLRLPWAEGASVADLLREAAGLIPAEDRFRAELEAELANELLDQGAPVDALAVVMAALDGPAAAPGRNERGMLLIALGQARSRLGELPEAKLALETALAELRGVDTHNEVVARIALVELALQAGDLGAAADQLHGLEAAADRLDPVQRMDVARLRAALRIALGQRGEAREHLEALLASTQGGPWEGAIRLELALLRLSCGETPDDLDRAVVDALAAPLGEGLTARLVELACNRGELLRPQTLERLLAWARDHAEPILEARMLERLGRAGEARARLARALAETIDDHVRREALHGLLWLTEDEGTLRAHTDALERLLDGPEDHPYVRVDLAEALRGSSEGDPSRLRRALSHAERALPGLAEGEGRRHGHSVLVKIWLDLLRADGPASTPEKAALAARLLDPLTLPEDELAARRAQAAEMLRFAGLLCHPEAADVAARLLAAAGTQADHPAPGAFEQIPGWLVYLVQGRPVALDPAEVADGLSHVQVALAIRPDATEAVLCALLPLREHLDPERWELLTGIGHDAVSSGHRGRGVLPRLLSLVEVMRATRDDLPLARLHREILRAREEVGDAATVEAAAPPDDASDPFSAFQAGVNLMDLARRCPDRDERARLLTRARELLQAAAAGYQATADERLFDALVSLGNACRLERQVEEALAFYDEAAALGSHAHGLAKLDKVRADALVARGEPDDLRQAWTLIARALETRREGWLRAETLASAARIASEHPDWDERTRVATAVERLFEACSCHAEIGEQLLPALQRLLARWAQLQPGAPRPREITRALGRLYPDQAEAFERSAGGLHDRLPDDLPQAAIRVMTHPATRALFEVKARLLRPQDLGHSRWDSALTPELKARLEAHREEHGIADRPDRLRAALAALDAPTDDAAAHPGQEVARAVLLAELARLGEATVGDVRAASDRGRQAARAVDDVEARATLLRTLATLWAPQDHRGDPVRDFDLARDLAAEAVALQGGEDNASRDDLEALARATRYAAGGDPRQNLLEARRLWQRYVARSRAAGDTNAVANALHCLADLEAHIGDGDRVSRLQASIALDEEGVGLAAHPPKRAELTASLAWSTTMLALQQHGEEHVATLRRALATFDTVDLSQLTEHERLSLDLNRSVARSMLLRATEGQEADVAFWRERLSSLDHQKHAYNAATTRHNLANAMLTPLPEEPARLVEALGLLEEAIRLRTIEADARHHWETCQTAGAALAQALLPWTRFRREGLLWSPRQAWERARGWLKRAIRAARVLGPGEELARAAFTLAQLVPSAPSTRDALEVGDEAWAALAEARPYLLHDPDHAAQEAGYGLNTALFLAYRLAQEGVIATSPGAAFVLDGARAERVLRWVLRGQAPVRHTLAARLEAPPEVPATTWLRWRSALEGEDVHRRIGALAEVRAKAPRFLALDPDLAATRAWLRRRPGSAAVTVVLGRPHSLALVLQVDGRGQDRVRVLGLPAPAPPDEAALARALRGIPEGSPEATRACEGLVEWGRRAYVEPVERFLGGAPTSVLWAPLGPLRLAPPAALWPRSAVVSATGLALPDLRGAPARHRSTLVALADPDTPRDGLGEAGLRALSDLARRARARGPVRLVGSVGARFGAALLGPETRDTPASARDLLAEAPDHDVLVLIAHGRVEALDEAWLQCVGRDGRGERLDVRALGESPGRFTGATVLLLSCEAGRVGEAVAAPAGIAGVLIAAGAAAVLAPLWPVRLDVAAAVAGAVLDGLAAGRPVEEAVQRAVVPDAATGPALGPLTDPASRQASGQLQRLAFVTWVG